MKFIKKLQNKTTIVTKEKKLKLNNNLSSNKNLHLNKISNLNFQLLSIDSRILPLFRTHIVKAKKEELKFKDTKLGSLIKSHTQNSVLQNRNQNNLNKLNTNQIFKIFLKRLIKYNLNLKSYMLQKNKLNFLINIKKDNLYILNTNISKFIIQTNNLISPFEDKHVILKNKNINKNKIIKLRENGKEFINYNFVKLIFKYSDTLFFSNLNYFLKKQYKFKFSYFNQNLSVYQVHLLKRIRFKYESKKIITVIRKITSEQIKIERQQLKELKKFGKKILKDLNYQILITQNLNNYLKINNKVLNYLNYILSLYLDSRNSNYAATNSNCNKSKIIGFDSENLNLNLIKKNNNLVENLTNTNTNNNTNTNTTNNNNTNMEEFYKNLFLTKMLKLNLVNKWNLIQIEHTIKSIIKNKKFNYKTDPISIKSNPISVVYFKNKNFVNDSNFSYFNTPILNKYLQVMSKYNMINKNIYIYYSNIIGFNFINENNKLFKNIYKLLAYSFKSMFCLISKPVFLITPDKIIIQLFYYLFIPNILKAKKFYNIVKKNRKKNLRFYLIWKKRNRNRKRLYRKIRKFRVNTRVKLRKLYLYNITKIFPNKFQNLCEILSNLFKKSIEFNLIRLHYPYNDSNILANLLAIFINRIKLRIIAKRLFGKAVIKYKTNNKSSSNNVNKLKIIPAFLSGINIKVAGRLLNNKKVPRKTVKTVRRGAVSKGKINYLDVARSSNKNKRGAYSITVSSGQKFF